MKTKKVIKDKTVYGGMFVDKYFLHFEDGTDIQVPFYEWDQLKVGDEYIIEEIIPDSFGVDPDPFVEAMKDIAEGRTVPLDKALNEKPSNSWEKLFDMQTKLVTHYVLENEKLKDEIKLLKNSVESVKNSFEYFQERFYKQRDLTEKLRKEIRMLEKLIELNMKDLHDIADQRDWYYEEYQKLKEENKNNQIKNTVQHK
jgi:archaellum component FlaC